MKTSEVIIKVTEDGAMEITSPFTEESTVYILRAMADLIETTEEPQEEGLVHSEPEQEEVEQEG